MLAGETIKAIGSGAGKRGQRDCGSVRFSAGLGYAGRIGPKEVPVARWEERGCPECRKRWATYDPPPKIGESFVRQCSLHRCEACGVLWELNYHHPDIISEEDARKHYSFRVT